MDAPVHASGFRSSRPSSQYAHPVPWLRDRLIRQPRLHPGDLRSSSTCPKSSVPSGVRTRADGVFAVLPQTASQCAKMMWCRPQDGEMKDTMIGVALAKNVLVRPASRVSFCFTGGDIP